jgi:hypothetical protein
VAPEPRERETHLHELVTEVNTDEAIADGGGAAQRGERQQQRPAHPAEWGASKD